MIRRRALLILAALAIAALPGCAGNTPATTAAGATPDAGTPAAPLGTVVPKGTKLIIGDPQTQIALQSSGLIDKLTFEVQWANISGGPQTTEAFRAGALDVGSVADIPPIHATWTGLDVRIITARFRKDPVQHPLYQLGIAPGADIKSPKDLKGKKIAYSPGQAQGALVLRVLKSVGLTKEDVELVELPSTADTYSTALQSKQVDAAPIGGAQVKRYLAKFGSDGATAISHGLRDDPSHLYVLKATLDDPAKAAALREYTVLWGQAWRWVEDHPDEWAQKYYIEDQGLKPDDAKYLIEQVGEPDVPGDWTDAIKRHQETIDLLAKETNQRSFPAENLYDKRFEKLGHDAYEGGASP
jgi:sulfonate transport system substrate-binding protein